MKPSFLIVSLVLAVSAAACQAPDITAYDATEKFPLAAEKKTAVLFVEPTADGSISHQDQVRLNEYAQAFRERNAGNVGIAIGAAGDFDPTAVALADNLRQALAKRGVPPETVEVTFHTADTSLAPHRATLMFPLYEAVLPDCGITNDRPEITFYNENTGNFGCSVQRNIALMTVNPLDLEQPQPRTGRLGARSTENVTDYVNGEQVGASTETLAIDTESTE